MSPKLNDMEASKRLRLGLIGWLVVALGLAYIAATGGTAVAQYGPKTNTKPEYRGPLEGGRKSRVRFDVQRLQGERAWVIFEVRNVRLRCSDGTRERAHFTAQQFHFQRERPRVFHGRYKEWPASYPEGYGGSYRVRGKLLKGGKARGHLQTTTRVPPEEGPTCNTDGRLRWNAKRVG